MRSKQQQKNVFNKHPEISDLGKISTLVKKIRVPHFSIKTKYTLGKKGNGKRKWKKKIFILLNHFVHETYRQQK